MSFTTPITESDVTGLVADLALKAPLASPTFTGHPVGVTEAALNNSTRLATTAYTDTAVGVETTRATTAEALLAPRASPTLTGTVTVPNGAGASDIAAFGQLPTAGSVGGLPKLIFRTGDSTPINTTSTLANDDTLLFAVGANDRWIFQAYIVFTAANSSGAATTADLKTTWTVPASGVMQHGWFGVPNQTFNGYGSTPVANSPNAVKVAASTMATGGDAVSWGISYAGYYTGGGTAGNVTFQWTQNTSNAATLLVAKNSLIIAWRIA